jgi:hypothetical protein
MWLKHRSRIHSHWKVDIVALAESVSPHDENRKGICGRSKPKRGKHRLSGRRKKARTRIVRLIPSRGEERCPAHAGPNH